jgi:hypothetical protein
MPALGMALNTALMPYGMNPPLPSAPPGTPAEKLPPWNLNSKMMMVRIGMATFHHVMALLTPGEQPHREEVDRGEDGHQQDRHPEAEPGDVARGRVVDAVPVILPVLHDRVALDRRDGDRLQPREEAERDAGHAAEREVREPGRPARDGVHPAELGVQQRQDDSAEASYEPAVDGGRPGQDRGAHPGEQPTRADKRGLGRQVAPISPISRLRPTSVGPASVAPVSTAMIDLFSDRAPRRASLPRCEVSAPNG